jgi:outer membrane lipoprotein-sorting protein
MRWLLTVTVGVLATPVFAGENDAEKLFRQMEKKVKAAKTIQIRFDLTLKFFGADGTLKGTSVFGEADKLRLDAKGSMAGQNIEVTAIGDGTKMHLIDREKAQTKVEDSPKGVGGYFRAVLPRIGIFSGIEDASKGKELPNVDEYFKVSDFKLGAKEKVGNAETRLVEYTVLFRGKDKGSVKVWINTKSTLPAKLEIRAEAGGVTIEILETYTEYALDGKLDAKLFEAPK